MNKLNIKTLQPWLSRSDAIGDAARRIEDVQLDYVKRKLDYEQENRHLSIGIMGQVKAGKSSFLNALLFAGQPVLPEAATPKTANLTRITWGEQAALEVEFYTPDEWQQLCVLAGQPGESQQNKVARELLAMVEAEKLDAAAILAEPRKRVEAATTEALLGLLNDYTGNNGRFTPLVKMTHIYLPIESLKGYAVVDTPGMNDPVISRTNKTREYMAECDVAFFLSRASQFLDKSDMDLLANQLPGKGVKRMALLACQMDSALLDDGYDRKSLGETEANLQRRLGKRAHDELEKLAEMRDSISGHEQVAALLRSMKTPIFSSTYSHAFVNLPADAQSKSMQHVYQALQQMAAECWDSRIESEDWMRIGNFSALEQAYTQARADKDAVLREQLDGLEPELDRNTQAATADLVRLATQQIQILQTSDLLDLQKAQASIDANIKDIAKPLESILEGVIGKAKERQRALLASLEEARQSKGKLQTRTGTERHSESYQVSNFKLFSPSTWFQSETRYRTYTSSYQYIAAADAVEQITRYEKESADRIERDFAKLVDAKSILLKMKKALSDVLLSNAKNFDPKAFRSTLDSSLDSLKIPNLKLDTADAGQIVSSQFGGEVRDSDGMQELQASLDAALNAVHERLSKGVQKEGKKLIKQLESLVEELQSKLTAGLEREMTSLRCAFADKENEISSLQSLVQIVKKL